MCEKLKSFVFSNPPFKTLLKSYVVIVLIMPLTMTQNFYFQNSLSHHFQHGLIIPPRYTRGTYYYQYLS